MEQNIKNIFTDFATQMEKDVRFDNYSDTELINKWTIRLLSLSNEFRKDTKKLSFKEIYLETLLAICNKTENNLLFEGIPTGLTDLDNITGGLPLGELTVLGARPAMGKTSFLVSVMANSIIAKNEPIAYFSMENSVQNIMIKLLSNVSQYSQHSLVSEALEPYEIDAIVNKTKILAEGNITIDDSCYTIDDIISQTYFLTKEKGVKLIIVDYLQLVQTKAKMHREQEVARVCRELKSLARKYNIAVLVSSQLSRSVETRGGDKKPQLSDLRESGAIEQDADKVLFLHRPEYYNITEDENGHDTRGVAEIIVAKNRGGFVGSAKVRFNKIYTAFEHLDPFDASLTPRSITNNELFKNIRKDEFQGDDVPLIRGSKMNDIEEDHPF